MLFNSLTFWIFLPVFLGLYFLTKRDALSLDFSLYPFADFGEGLSVEVSSDLKSWNVSDDVMLNIYEESANAWQHRLYFPKSSKRAQFGRLRFLPEASN